MAQFLKFVLATVVGLLLTGFIAILILIGFIVAATSDKSEPVAANSILNIKIDHPISERTPNNPFAGINLFGFNNDKSIGLNDILANIKKAKTDNNIRGIFISDSYMLSGQATTEEIRKALIDFKTSGKFVVAYAEIYTQSFYYLASVADKVYLNPKGIFDFGGFVSQITFLKGTLDKLGVEAQIIKVGTYKSAVEPFVLTKMSDANREQVTSYMGSLYDYFIDNIGASRHIPTDTLRDVANNLRIQFPEDALKYRLVDGLKYKDEVLDLLKDRVGVEHKKDLKSIDIEDYTDSKESKPAEKSGSQKIAVVYASGDINSGEGDDNSIGSEKISAALRKARTDDDVKAVVLRVNSPGGSSLASAVIWREVVLTKKVKPVIVSMGDYAASGGYYISCAADSIFAEPNTVTGSIGIFAILPNMQKLFNDKLGVTFDGVKTGKYSDLGNISRPLTPEERTILQTQVNRGYDEFTQAVAEGRHKTQVYVNSIGQGRVWTGTQALKIGLVDRLGNINDAIASAAKKAKLKNYKLVAYPEQKSIFSKLGSDMSDNVKTSMMKKELGENYMYYEQVRSLQSMMRTPQARMPYQVNIK